MQVVIDSITINDTNRYGRIVADIEFNNVREVVKDIGLSDCLEAFTSSEVLAEVGWREAEDYFAGEIQERIDEAVTEKDEEIKRLEARIYELEDKA